MCPVCHDDEEIMVRRPHGGVMPLSCPACFGLAPIAVHLHRESFDDALEACALRGVEAKRLAVEDVEALDLTEEMQGADGEWRALWRTLGMGSAVLTFHHHALGPEPTTRATTQQPRRVWAMPEARR